MNASSFRPPSIVAWVGLDWADQRHVVCLYDVASTQVESHSLEQSAQALQDWIGRLRARYGGAPVALVLEQSRGPVLYALLSCDFAVLYPVNPESLADYRKAFSSRGAKSGPSDAALLMEMVRKHPERFRPWVPDDAETRGLQLLVEGRRKLVGQKTSLTNQLTSLLKGYYPQALAWAGELGTCEACDFLKPWPTLGDLQKARPARIRQLYQSYGRLSPGPLEQRLEQIRQAQPLTQDSAVGLSSSMLVLAWVDQIRPLLASIERFDQQIGALFRKHPDRPLFESFPGAGSVLAPRLLAAFGADRERFGSARAIQQLSGIAPVPEQSGHQPWVHWRLACPKFFRQTFQEFAGHSRHGCGWAQAFYQQQRARGKGHQAAVRSLAYKWIRILYRCWQARTPYDEQIYLKSLEKRNPALLAVIQAQPPKTRNKKAAGVYGCEQLVNLV
jgi:transposase